MPRGDQSGSGERGDGTFRVGRRERARDSVANEPHIRSSGREVVGEEGSGCWRCGYSRLGIKERMPCPECGSASIRPVDAEPDESVWEEPTTSESLSGRAPDDAVTYARWLDARVAERDVGRSWGITGLLALAAGPFAIVGAFAGAIWGGGQGLFGAIVLVVFGPIVEEVCKVALATYVVERKPYLFLSRAQILICAGAAGLVFSVIENLLYLHVYVRLPSAELVLWRWTVCVALHVGCSMLAGMGLARAWRDGMRDKRRPDLVPATRWLVGAIVLHGAYNALAIMLERSGVLF